MSSALTRVLLLSFLLAVALSSPVPAQTPANTSADARLRALYTEEWDWRQKELGRGGAASDRFPRVDAASQQARLAYWTKTLSALDAIPFDQLSAEEKVNAQIFRTSLRELVSDMQYRTYEAPFNSDTFFWTSFTPRQGFANAAAYRSYLARLRDVPRYFDEQITNMRAGLARGYSVPRVSVIGRDQTIEPYVKGDASNPLYAPFAQMPAGIPAADQEALRAEANTVIRDIVAPAYANLLTMIRQEYLEKARRTLGASAMPDGAGVLPGADREAHHADADAEGDSRHRPEGSRPHRGRDARDQGQGEVQGDHGRVLHVHEDRPAVLREDAA